MAMLEPVDPDFRHVTLSLGGIDLHYAEAGDGEPVMLIAGWPQTWIAWRKVAPRLLAQGRRVICVDPRGIGDSSLAPGYTLDEAAGDIHALIAHLLPGQAIDIVSHDLGAAIAYSLACAWPEDVRRLVLSEVTFVTAGQMLPLPDDRHNLATWHFGFNRLPDLPELLVSGRERPYLDFLFETKAMRPAAIEGAARQAYADSLGRPGALTASFDYYRSVFSAAGLRRMEERLSTPIDMPVLAIGAAGGVGNLLAKALSRSATDLRSVLVANCGHYIPEEDPDAFAAAVIAFWQENREASSIGKL